MRAYDEFRERIAASRVLVAGDVMLDRYWFGEVERISPEAPVPVVHVSRTDERPGGAANVARNAASLGAQVTLLSVVGDDEPGRILDGLLRASRVRPMFQVDPGFSTIVKLRVISRQQQLLRIDFETPPGNEILAAKLAEYEALLPDVDVVILSDYGKGGLTHIARMIELARTHRIPVLVDPKGEDFSKYAGATLLTPNRAEFRQVAGRWNGEAEFGAKAQALRQRLDLTGLLVTRSEEGMTLFVAGATHHTPTLAQEVFDVSGAGDTVIATLGVMIAAGADLPVAVGVANHAAGIVVGKLGTAVVLPEELGG
ncbi:MAG: D-glycero-beta-D-manno-heptose-7-phosphate kinase [Betaproteobacteria bacterium]|nr:D-glycero-beta-D-manno-heptose-7-phosphate kinase [Betaproteobacteria bacterium]